MNIPLTITPAPPRKRRRRKQAATSAPPVQPFTLVAATYDPDFGPTLTLVFDRAINFDSFDGAQIIVDDNASLNLRFHAGGEFTVSPANTIAITLNEIDSASGSGVTLDASTDTGLVAADDGSPWAGVTDLELPFP
ncbi:hypothetical protein BH09PLA1_BH09PLA1_02290 [soil metagenome]